jgi:hypothetical protein
VATPRNKSEDAEPAAEAPEPREAAPAASQPSGGEFPVERLITEAPALLGVPTYVAAGAFHEQENDLSLDDAKAAVEKWLETPAHQEA